MRKLIEKIWGFKKYFNLKKEIIVDNVFMVIRIFKINKGENINTFIESKLKEEFYDYKDFLVHNETVKTDNGKFLVIYIIKDTKEINEYFKKYDKLKIIPYQFKLSNDIKIKAKDKKLSGLCTVKYANNICILSYTKGILTSFQIQDLGVDIKKSIIEEDTKYKKYFTQDRKLYIEEEIFKGLNNFKNKKEVVFI